MTTPQRCARIVLAAALLALSATQASATGMPAISLPDTRAFTAGETIRVGWENLPKGVEELEFFLVRGDSVEEIVRLTPQLVPARGSFAWKVPNLASDDATLRLRVGIDGEEIEIADSDSFSIRETSAKAAQIEFRDGEWWASDPLHPWSAPADPSRARASQPTQDVVLAVQRPVAHLPALSAITAIHGGDYDAVASKSPTLSRAPLVVPQRK